MLSKNRSRHIPVTTQQCLNNIYHSNQQIHILHGDISSTTAPLHLLHRWFLHVQKLYWEYIDVIVPNSYETNNKDKVRLKRIGFYEYSNYMFHKDGQNSHTFQFENFQQCVNWFWKQED